MNYDSEEFKELKKLRRLKVNSSRESMSIEEIMAAGLDDDLLESDTINKTVGDSTNIEPSNNKNKNKTSSDDDESDYYIRLGGFKIRGIWEIAISILTMVVFLVFTWVRFETSLRTNADDITQIQSEYIELKNFTRQHLPLIQQNIESRLNIIERELIILTNRIDYLETSNASQLARLTRDVENLREYRISNNTDITTIMRRLNQIEDRLGL